MSFKKFSNSGLLFLVFIFYTLTVKLFDVKPIGPQGSEVGFATINGFVAKIFKYNDLFYDLTKVIALIAFLYIGAFAIMGLVQLIKKKSFAKVDLAIYGMAGIYALTAMFYILFEILIINYRPVLDEGELEASYPSSHTMLAVSVFGCALVYFLERLKASTLKTILVIASGVFAFLMAFGRLISGVHWFTDILGGVILGCAITSFYWAFVKCSKPTE
ncbi:MAG: phosphatase PAP2 family protein [Lachnospiraceae bacterium]|nr:phosphatase PAP2 family protein [Lachnospiraceae bacterium]